ncbi:MAG: non-canonical purine NTP pyrophosphatase, partial [Planctomycetota bacterium]|nr:non-canonical purine NTP pyrophosphatase [Planctomycetota bacterium]
TYAENAALKALEWAKKYGCLALADDSGLEVAALENRPGIHSAYYAFVRGASRRAIETASRAADRRSARETSALNIRRLLDELRGMPAGLRRARFVCVMALAVPGRIRYGATRKRHHTAAAEVVFFGRGTCRGRITTEPRGALGFGYDPVFYSSELGRTFAEAGQLQKNKVSHRARALEQVRSFLEKRLPRIQRLFPRIPEMDRRGTDIHSAR